jgi:hypothetical protein
MSGAWQTLQTTRCLPTFSIHTLAGEWVSELSRLITCRLMQCSVVRAAAVCPARGQPLAGMPPVAGPLHPAGVCVSLFGLSELLSWFGWL